MGELDAVVTYVLAFVMAVGVEAIVVGALVALLKAWYEGWKGVMKLMWYGHDVTNSDDAPPQWRRDIALFAYGMYNFKRPSEIHEAIKDAHGK